MGLLAFYSNWSTVVFYTKQFDVEGVVSDTVSERAVVQQIALIFQKPDPMFLPVYEEEGATFSLFRSKVVMDLYDLLR